MTDFHEIDFMNIDSNKSGDAIAIRYEINGIKTIHIVDAGFQETGPKIVENINNYYQNPSIINHVVATHPDADHAGGLRTILEEFNVGAIWMHRPWLYADELLENFTRFTNVANLKTRLKELYPNIVALEELANKKNIPINEAFQGTKIGEFTVMAPSRANYLNLVVQSEKTPESNTQTSSSFIEQLTAATKTLLNSAWGLEVFSTDETSAENEMSIVQFCCLNNTTILLTADTGRTGLRETINYAPSVSLSLPGIDRFQVPHHGSRRNISSELLNEILGPKNHQQSEGTFSAIICASKEDKDHPKNAVVRAMIHRGGNVATTQNCGIRYSGGAAPNRVGWSPVTPLEYPNNQEE